MTKLRYTVGESYVFARAFFTPKAGEFAPFYIPSRCHLDQLLVVKVTCTEHHRVPVEYYEEQGNTADGFLFTDAEGRLWENQYPKASYGQTSTEGNQKIRLYVSDSDWTAMSKTDQDAIMKDPHSNIFGFTDALYLLADIESCIRNERLEPEDMAGMPEFRDLLRTTVETLMGHSLDYKPFTMTFKDGSVFESKDRLVAFYKEAA